MLIKTMAVSRFKQGQLKLPTCLGEYRANHAASRPDLDVTIFTSYRYTRIKHQRTALPRMYKACLLKRSWRLDSNQQL